MLNHEPQNLMFLNPNELKNNQLVSESSETQIELTNNEIGSDLMFPSRNFH